MENKGRMGKEGEGGWRDKERGRGRKIRERRERRKKDKKDKGGWERRLREGGGAGARREEEEGE